MRYIKSYANDAAIQGAVDSNLLGHPYIALNDQTGTIDWNSKVSLIPPTGWWVVTSDGNAIQAVDEVDGDYTYHVFDFTASTSATFTVYHDGQEYPGSAERFGSIKYFSVPECLTKNNVPEACQYDESGPGRDIPVSTLTGQTYYRDYVDCHVEAANIMGLSGLSGKLCAYSDYDCYPCNNEE